MQAIDFDTLTAEETDALSGPAREAWYAHRNGNAEKVAEIFAAYPDPELDVEPATDEEPDAEPTTEPTPRQVQAAKRKAAAAEAAAAKAQG